MTAARSSTGNCDRFAACPLTEAGTPTETWLDALARMPALDLPPCDHMVVVAAHPDDETLGFGATIATLADRGVEVQLVVASDGGASYPGLTSSQSRELVEIRHAELLSAISILGLSSPIWFGLPDGALRGHEEQMTGLLGDVLAGMPRGTPCAANWRGDGHPDHEAVGRAAAAATAATGSRLLEYPVWMWHWATPGDQAVPWERLAATPISEDALACKAAAAQCYRSQRHHAETDVEPVLPDFVMDRLLRVREVAFG